MSFSDPNGEIQTLRGRVELWPASVTVGIKVADWASAQGNGNRVEVVVLDTSGKPLAGQAVSVKGKRRIDTSHRRRIVGGFYAYENNSEYKDIGEVCAGTTDSRGLLLCEPKAGDSGSIYLLAEARDGKAISPAPAPATGSPAPATCGSPPAIRIASTSSRKRKATRPARSRASRCVPLPRGQRADFRRSRRHHRNLRPAAVALQADDRNPGQGRVGAERFCLGARRARPRRAAQVVQLLPMGLARAGSWFKEWWNPEQPTAMVDLAKPAYRLGLGEIAVGTDGFKLKVEISSDKSDYRPREEATVRIKVTTPDGKPAPAGTEVAFAAVDQALLELRPNNSWNLLDALLQKRGYEVETATAQAMVIGKRHFGKKALPPGGGGGRAPARELFDTLLHVEPARRP
jgi:hypothetical protein